MRMNHFTRYTPKEPAFGPSALYLQDDKGNDWYASQNKFTKAYKLAISPDSGTIRCIAEDVSALFPNGLSVVDIDTLPDGCDISGDWVYQNGSVKLADGAVARQAANQKDSLMQQANYQVQVLSDAVELEMATEEEKTALPAWRKYRVMLARINPQDAPSIDWPHAPNP
ncbi:tail fiber assembly protein [Serratia rubidaea]|nr:tail fiber assembly protein [Serratia rubidaea]